MKHPRLRRIFLYGCILLVLFELGLAAAIHFYGLTDRTQPVDVIIVLGAGLYMVPRAEHAALLWKKGVAPTIICTGGFTERPTLSEAEACNAALQMVGVPAQAIIKEETSRSTIENAIASRKIMTANGWYTAVIVSDSYHLLRAEWLFNSVGITSYPSPVLENQLPTGEYVRALLREMGAIHLQMFKNILGLQEFVGKKSL